MDFALPEHRRACWPRSTRSSSGDQAAGSREHAVLRPPARVRPHRLRERRRAAAGWEELLAEMRRRADAAGWLRYGLPREFGGQDGSNLEMAIIREHLAAQGPRAAQRPAERELDRRQLPDGAHDATTSAPTSRRREWMPGFLDGERAARLRADRAEPRLRRDVARDDRRAATATSGCINGTKRFNTGLHHATHDIVFARTSGEPGRRARHHRLPRADRRAGLQRRLLSGGRSTCRPTTPR